MSQHAPSNSRYAPVHESIPTKSSVVRFLPEEGDNWGPVSHNVIRFRIRGQKFIDFEKSYIECTLVNNAGALNQLSPDSGVPFIQRLVVRQAGRELNRIDHYGRYFAARMGGTLSPSEYRAFSSGCCGGSDATDGMYDVPIVGQIDALATSIPAAGTRRYSFPLWGCAVFESGKLFPTPLMGHEWLEIELTLAPGFSVGVSAINGAAPIDVDYSIVNPAVVCQCVELDPGYVEMLRTAMHDHGSLSFHGASVEGFTAQVGVADQHVLRVPTNKKNVRGVLTTCAANGYLNDRTSWPTSCAQDLLTAWQWKCASEVYPAIAHTYDENNNYSHLAAEARKFWEKNEDNGRPRTCFSRHSIVAAAPFYAAGDVAAFLNHPIPMAHYCHRFSAFGGESELATAGLNTGENGVVLELMATTILDNTRIFNHVEYEQRLFLRSDGFLEERS